MKKGVRNLGRAGGFLQNQRGSRKKQGIMQFTLGQYAADKMMEAILRCQQNGQRRANACRQYGLVHGQTTEQARQYQGNLGRHARIIVLRALIAEQGQSADDYGRRRQHYVAAQQYGNCAK